MGDQVIVDDAHGRLFVPSDVGTLAIDASDFGILERSPRSGGIGLDTDRRRLYIDDFNAGLWVLDADTMEELKFIPVERATDAAASSGPVSTATPGCCTAEFKQLPPLADTVTGHVLVVRGNELLELDPDTGTVGRHFADKVAGPAAIAMWAVLDAPARLLHVLRIDDDYTSGCHRWHTRLTTTSLATGRTVMTSPFCYDTGSAVAWNGKLLVGFSERLDALALVFRSGRQQLKVDAWPWILEESSPPIWDEQRQTLFAMQQEWPGNIIAALRTDDLSESGIWQLPDQSTWLAAVNSAANELIVRRRGRLSKLPIGRLDVPTPLAELPAVPTASLVDPRSYFHSTPTANAKPTLVAPTASVKQIAVKPPAIRRCPDSYGIAPDEFREALRLPDGSWRLIDTALPCALEGISPSPHFAADGIAIATSDGLILRTADGGRSWSPASRGLSSRDITQVEFSPTFSTDHTVYLSTGSGVAFRSVDSGVSWRGMGDLHALAAIGHDEGDRRMMAFRSHTSDVMMSSDGGATWRRRGRIVWPNVESEGSWLSTDTAADGTTVVYAELAFGYSHWRNRWPDQQCASFRSTDLGRSWTMVGEDYVCSEGQAEDGEATPDGG